MAIPDFQFVMLPLVKILGDGQEWTMRDVTDLLAESLTDDPSVGQSSAGH
jgi:restriction endonuclease Mrr